MWPMKLISIEIRRRTLLQGHAASPEQSTINLLRTQPSQLSLLMILFEAYLLRFAAEFETWRQKMYNWAYLCVT